MAYDTTVPKTGSNGASDYQAMQGNYAQIQTSFSIDHEPLGSSGAIEGFHKKTTFAAPIADPGQASPVASLYTKTVSGASQLFFQNGALAANVAQLTGNAVLTAGEYTVVSPWGLIFKFGVASVASASNYLFQTAFTNNGLGVIVTLRLASAQSPLAVQDAAILTGANNATGFTPFYGIGGAQSLYYFAWGN